MDRRKFLNISAGAAVATGVAGMLPGCGAAAGVKSTDSDSATRAGEPVHIKLGEEAGTPLKMRFLGTGAADWNGRDDRAREDFAKAAKETGIKTPEIVPLSPGDKVTICGMTLTALPANHATGDLKEQTLMYLIEKQAVRVMYATDTGGIPAIAARIVGIDPHAKGKPITGLVMEATMGMGTEGDEDFRLFTHSSVGTVLRTTHMLLEKGRYTPSEGQPVYLTHLARTLHGTQAELDANLPKPLKAAYDGLEVIFTA